MKVSPSTLFMYMLHNNNHKYSKSCDSCDVFCNYNYKTQLQMYVYITTM